MQTLRLVLALSCAAAFSRASAQDQVIASVPVAEASTSGVLAVSSGKDLLGGASVITALDRPAHVSLFRGGELLVCQTSVTHLTSGARAQQLLGKQTPLLISLDRGAVELRMPISADDVFLTPDLRFVAADARAKPASLDLAIRVAPGGDTCVENRGKKAPTLQITDTFGQAAYLLKPGQHVLFEHGALTEVVDHESSPCGCPPPQSMSLADAALRGKGKGGQPFPFPAAVSEGLAPASPLPAEKPGEVHTQVAGTLTYDPSDTPPATPPSAPQADTQVQPAKALPPLTPADEPPPPPGLFHAVGRFFKKIFAR